MTAAEEVAALAADLGGRLPPADLYELSRFAGRGVAGLAGLRACSPSPVIRGVCLDLERVLAFDGCSAEFLAGALAGAAAAAARARAELSVDVVWTGPSSSVTTTRLTSGAIGELIDEATDTLLLASYATHDHPLVVTALHRAVDRGVHVTMLLERPSDNARFAQAATPFAGVKAQRLSWPAGVRESGAAMHAKILVVDQRTVLVGSANITGHALDRNLECGLLVRGGSAARNIWAHITALHDAGVLVRARF